VSKTRIIDLSMEVHPNMMVYADGPRPSIDLRFSHSDNARRYGAEKYGVDETTGAHWLAMSDHTGTHLDSWWHGNPQAPTIEATPLEYCYGDGVVLDVTHRKPGEGITSQDLKDALARIGYSLKPLDIVLIRTDAYKLNETRAYITDHPGMTAEATRWLIDQGIKVMGIDAIGFDRPIPVMVEKKEFWEAHRVMREKEYYHLENMANFDQIPKPFGFKVSVLPIKLRGASAAPVRAVAIVEEGDESD
jgi:kynurenine formamidase